MIVEPLIPSPAVSFIVVAFQRHCVPLSIVNLTRVLPSTPVHLIHCYYFFFVNGENGKARVRFPMGNSDQ
jgi:hypothetical protein